MGKILSVDQVTKIFATGSVTTRALAGVSFDVEKGEFVAVMGPSGSGKSTLLNVISTIEPLSGGNITVDGESIVKRSDDEIAAFRRDKLGFIFQEYNLLDTLTIAENIVLPLNLKKMSARETAARLADTAEKLGVSDQLNKYPYELSGGQRQRVACARAVIAEPALVLADEPTGALDSESGEQVMALLKELSAEKLVVVVSHDADFAERYADGIIEMKDGKILSERGVRAEEGEAPSERPLSPAHLPARYAFRIGMRSLRAKPVRLAFTVLLSLVAFLCFGLFSTMALYSEKNAAISSLAACSDHGYIAGSKVYERELVQYKDGKEVSSSFEQVQTGYTLAEFLDISERFPGAIAMAKAELSFSPPLSLEGSVGQFYSKTLSGFVLADESMDWLAGRAPVGENEIALTDFVFSCMQYGEFRENSLQEPPVLAQYEDVIGKEVTFAVNGSTYR